MQQKLAKMSELVSENCKEAQIEQKRWYDRNKEKRVCGGRPGVGPTTHDNQRADGKMTRALPHQGESHTGDV